MCGVAGVLGDGPINGVGVINAMNSAQTHRGPDGHGVYSDELVALGHRRLAILDLSDVAKQPMQSPCGRYVIVFNGEIYNYKELREELKSKHRFDGDGDTEVLLAAWAAWGPDCLDRLRGMFAFCVWDAETRTAHFARDRFGQKPLFFAEVGGQVVFASEIKALLAAGIEAKPNRDVWLRYLAYASYDDNAETFFSGIEQLLPGCLATWAPGRELVRSRWYNLTKVIPPLTESFEVIRDRLRDTMLNVSRVHMRSDVPVGISLSGGFDSSALVAGIQAARRLQNNTAGFSVDFGGPSGYSESAWIQAAADHHGLNMYLYTYEPEDMLQDFELQLWHAEAPLGGLMNLGRAHVMKKAAEQGLKVLQDGTGLDEAFGGYELHHAQFVGEQLVASTPEAEDHLKGFAAFNDISIEEARSKAMASIASQIGKAIDGTTLTMSDLLSVEARDQARTVSRSSDYDQTGDAVRDSFLDYVLVRKIPRNTRFTDRMSMAYGVELRFPFLDHHLIELGLRIPHALQFLYGRSKSMVREAMMGLMDDDVRTAKKRSVHTPQGEWLRHDPIKCFVGDLIHSQSFRERGFFNHQAVLDRFDDFCLGGFKNSFFVWQWINTEVWYRRFIG